LSDLAPAHWASARLQRAASLENLNVAAEKFAKQVLQRFLNSIVLALFDAFLLLDCANTAGAQKTAIKNM